LTGSTEEEQFHWFARSYLSSQTGL
jgi:hypothetical protein